MSEESPEDAERRTSKRRAARVLSILKGGPPCRKPPAWAHGGRDRGSRESGFCWPPKTSALAAERDEEALKGGRIKKIERKIGERVVDMDIQREGMGRYLPLEQDVRVLSLMVGVSERKA